MTKQRSKSNPKSVYVPTDDDLHASQIQLNQSIHLGIRHLSKLARAQSDLSDLIMMRHDCKDEYADRVSIEVWDSVTRLLESEAK